MRLPFTTSEFLGVFRLYNEAVWPAQWVLTAMAAAIVVLALTRWPHAPGLVASLLAGLWLWTGAVYHLAFFTRINGAAYLFGALFVAQAALLFRLARRDAGVTFSPRRDAAGLAGWALVAYALLVYPALGHALGHRYPASPTFGLPCPTTIFTLGVLLWMRPAVPWRVLVVPLLWALVGTSAALRLGMTEDLGLPAAAALVVVVRLLTRASREPRPGVAPAAT